MAVASIHFYPLLHVKASGCFCYATSLVPEYIKSPLFTSMVQACEFSGSLCSCGAYFGICLAKSEVSVGKYSFQLPDSISECHSNPMIDESNQNEDTSTILNLFILYTDQLPSFNHFWSFKMFSVSKYFKTFRVNISLSNLTKSSSQPYPSPLPGHFQNLPLLTPRSPPNYLRKRFLSLYKPHDDTKKHTTPRFHRPCLILPTANGLWCIKRI